MDRNKEKVEEIKARLTKERIEKMREAPCAWPGCKRKQFINVTIQALMRTESGGLVDANTQRDAQGRDIMSLMPTIPICALHFPFAGEGLLAAVVDDKMNIIGWHGAFEADFTIAVIRALESADKMAKDTGEKPLGTEDHEDDEEVEDESEPASQP